VESGETPCPARERLENLVQHFLCALAELAGREAEVIKTGDKVLMMEIDRNIETVIGEKERAMGALMEHRSTHHC